MDEEAVFTAALEIEPADLRAAYLDQACAGNPDLRRQVEELLGAHGRAGSFLDKAAAGWNAHLPIGDLQSGAEGPGTVIGPYRLLEQIGEGGMGLVFMAEQTRPVRRRVALKVIKPGMDSRQVVARFEAERQALALMDHPHIAEVFDAGATESGRPYFVMELVKGVPITEFCDQRRLTTRQRLELFAAVCQAIQHAHQKGIIHRDLKPSNVLVTLHDTVAVPKVIDFGIAKATGQALTERTLFTHFAQMVGTPLYMSPEQAEMNGLDVDTRSDVYSLGVMLYELLTGSTPFEGETLTKVGQDEMRRLIRDEEPPRPSQRIHTLSAEACTTVSERRGVDGRRLGQVLRGELDWIVMKALEKDRNSRYESVSALAADVQRYLNDEAVAACPPSAGYRLRKFARRNCRTLVTVGVILVSLVAASAVSAWQAVVAREAQRQAEADRDRFKTAEVQAKTDRDRAQAAGRRAAIEAAIARAVNDFLQHDLLRQVNSAPQNSDEFGGNSNLTVKEALDRAASKIGERFQNQALVEAAIRMAIGEAYCSLSEHKFAVSHFEKAVALRRVSLGTNHVDTLSSMRGLARIYGEVGRSRDAVLLLEEVLEEYERLFGKDHSTTLECLSGLADACRRAGMWGRAIMLAEQVFEKRKATLGPTHPSTVGAMHTLARIYLHAGLLVESLAWHERTLAICHTSGADAGWVMTTNARALQGAGMLEEADCQLCILIELARSRSDHRIRDMAVATVQNILGMNLLLQGRYIEAEQVAREALAVLKKRTPDTWSLFHAMSMVGGALLGQREYARAEPFLLQGYEGMKAREAFMDIGFKHWLTKAGDRLIRFYEVTNQPDKARAWREKV
jgi:serine/threonine protein kinase